jgi:hypothetical protein
VDDGGEGLAALDLDLDVLRFLQRREVEGGKREAERQEDGQDEEEKAEKKISHRVVLAERHERFKKHPGGRASMLRRDVNQFSVRLVVIHPSTFFNQPAKGSSPGSGAK